MGYSDLKLDPLLELLGTAVDRKPRLHSGLFPPCWTMLLNRLLQGYHLFVWNIGCHPVHSSK